MAGNSLVTIYHQFPIKSKTKADTKTQNTTMITFTRDIQNQHTAHTTATNKMATKQ